VLHETEINDIRVIINGICKEANLLADALQDDDPIRRGEVVDNPASELKDQGV